MDMHYNLDVILSWSCNTFWELFVWSPEWEDKLWDMVAGDDMD